MWTESLTSRLCVPPLPAMPVDPGEQGDPLHAESPAKAQRELGMLARRLSCLCCGRALPALAMMKNSILCCEENLLCKQWVLASV